MKLKPKDIAIIILIIILIAVSFAWFIREGLNLHKINKISQTYLEKERSYEITLTQFIVDYDRLYKHYQKFTEDYRQLLTEQEVSDARLNNEMIKTKYQEFEVTAYTSQECGTITSIGLNLQANYSKYLNICAVDPLIIPYGSTVLIEFSDGSIRPYVAADCGGLIKGKKIDLYFTDVEKAIEFGRQKLMVKVVK